MFYRCVQVQKVSIQKGPGKKISNATEILHKKQTWQWRPAGSQSINRCGWQLWTSHLPHLVCLGPRVPGYHGSNLERDVIQAEDRHFCLVEKKMFSYFCHWLKWGTSKLHCGPSGGESPRQETTTAQLSRKIWKKKRRGVKEAQTQVFPLTAEQRGAGSRACVRHQWESKSHGSVWDEPQRARRHVTLRRKHSPRAENFSLAASNCNRFTCWTSGHKWFKPRSVLKAWMSCAISFSLPL